MESAGWHFARIAMTETGLIEMRQAKPAMIIWIAPLRQGDAL